MINLNKKYRTKSGFAVKLFEIIGDQVFGAYNHPDYGWQPTKWNIDHKHTNSGYGYDLIEVPLFEISSFTQYQLTKTVLVHGQSMTVPAWTKYVVIHIGGEVYALEQKPCVNAARCDTYFDFSNCGKIERVGLIGGFSGNVQDSLVEV